LRADVADGSKAAKMMETMRQRMSALLRKRTSRQTSRDVRFVPLADKRIAANNALFDHLVGAGEQQWRHVDAEQLTTIAVE
jgi:hypothetical protein